MRKKHLTITRLCLTIVRHFRSLQSASKWNSKKMAQPAYDKLIKNGEKNLEIVDSGQQNHLLK
ncbi:hypothetical protein A8C54_10540 [Ligilactobacillus salivarius]|nr:hypothetical protein A8C54_10540 [Ligilactobacillus salivarius]PAY37805.1 hypothetical protein A8C34_10685 [Ligilactobacillus salivarius]